MRVVLPARATFPWTTGNVETARVTTRDLERRPRPGALAKLETSSAAFMPLRLSALDVIAHREVSHGEVA